MPFVKLTKGVNYGYGNLVFRRDEPVEVSEELHELLTARDNFEDAKPVDAPKADKDDEEAEAEAKAKAEAEKKAKAEAEKKAKEAAANTVKAADVKPVSGAVTPPQA